MDGLVFPEADWQSASPESQGVDSVRLAQAIAYLESQAGRDGVRELFITRRGRVLWEGDHTHVVHGLWSMTKSFTSTVLGLLLDAGAATLDTSAYQHVPELAVAYSAVTLRHFATMTSGYRAVGDEPWEDYVHGPSRTPLLPDPEPLFAPGAAFAYWDSAMNELGYVLTRIAGEPLRALFQRRIGDRLGLRPESWKWGDLGEAGGLSVQCGAGNHGRVRMSARDVARLGQLFLAQGKWAGEQLLSAAWVQEATSVQVPATIPVYPVVAHLDGRGMYGYNWWVNGVGPEGTRRWPSAPPATYAASGYNNNDMFVIPEWGMVVVRLGLDEAERQITEVVYDQFLARLGEAIVD